MQYCTGIDILQYSRKVGDSQENQMGMVCDEDVSRGLGHQTAKCDSGGTGSRKKQHRHPSDRISNSAAQRQDSGRCNSQEVSGDHGNSFTTT